VSYEIWDITSEDWNITSEYWYILVELIEEKGGKRSVSSIKKKFKRLPKEKKEKIIKILCTIQGTNYEQIIKLTGNRMVLSVDDIKILVNYYDKVKESKIKIDNLIIK
jgi:hypothetical protein